MQEGSIAIRGADLARALSRLAVSHVIWVPDSVMGPWEEALEEASDIQLVRVCREGEAWAVAAGLHLGGKTPLVMIQTTGLFESGDALRNVWFDLGLPLPAIIGYRSYLVENSPDTARKFAEPILQAWAVDYRIVHGPNELGELVEYLAAARERQEPAVVLIAEGNM